MSYNRLSSAFLQTIVIWLLLWISSLSAATAENGESSVRVLFFGDSLTAGYGLDPSQAYPSLVEQKIEKAGLDATVSVGAVSGDTSAGGLRRIDWMLRQRIDVFVLALGANDGLRGSDLAKTEKNLQAIIDRVLVKYPNAKIVIAGMRMPPSLGANYTKRFAAIYPKLAKANDAALIPFLLEGVAGIAQFNLPDRIHPNARGHKRLAENVWEIIEPELK
ncbi:MAG: arylesterase [Verrucomicrobiota bacterium]